jgi:hypothetical protein
VKEVASNSVESAKQANKRTGILAIAITSQLNLE